MTSGKAPSLPGVAGTRLTAAGIDWDAVKVSRFHALQALERLDQPGSVAVDPAAGQPVLYFFVPPGTTCGWDIPHSTALSTATHVVLPPSFRDAPPGPYWLIPPERGVIQHTRTGALRLALAAGLLSPRTEPMP